MTVEDKVGRMLALVPEREEALRRKLAKASTAEQAVTAMADHFPDDLRGMAGWQKKVLAAWLAGPKVVSGSVVPVGHRRTAGATVAGNRGRGGGS